MTDDCSVVTHCRCLLLELAMVVVPPTLTPPTLKPLNSSQIGAWLALVLEGACCTDFSVPVSRQLLLARLANSDGASERMSVGETRLFAEPGRLRQLTYVFTVFLYEGTLLRKTRVADKPRVKRPCSRRVIFSGFPTYDYPSDRTFSQAPDRKSMMAR